MLCDLGAVVDQDTVERTLDWALRKGYPERWIREVHARVDRPGPSGTQALGRILDDPRRSGRLPDSWLERIIKRSAEAPDMPRFEVQHEVHDPRTGQLIAVLDGCWVDWKIGVEGHSKAFHGLGQKREWTDLVRDNAVKRLGYELIYVTWDLAHRPTEILETARDIHWSRATGSAQLRFVGVGLPVNCGCQLRVTRGGLAPSPSGSRPCPRGSGRRRRRSGTPSAACTARRARSPPRAGPASVTVAPSRSRDDRHDLLAPLLARPAGDHDVGDRRGDGAIACSTSSAKIFSPPELIVTESRPYSSIVPSAVNRARSPGTE